MNSRITKIVRKSRNINKAQFSNWQLKNPYFRHFQLGIQVANGADVEMQPRFRCPRDKLCL